MQWPRYLGKVRFENRLSTTSVNVTTLLGVKDVLCYVVGQNEIQIKMISTYCSLILNGPYSYSRYTCLYYSPAGK